MAIASGQVFARPLFCRLNMHVRTWNTHEVVLVSWVVLENSCLSSCKFHCNVALRFSGISVYSDEAHAVCGRCAQLSPHVESEITSLVPQAPSSFPSFAIRSASNEKNWAENWKQHYSFSTQSESESCLPMIIAKKQSLTNFIFFCCGCMLSICSCCIQ